MIPSSRSTTWLLGILTTILVGWVLHVAGGILKPLVIALLLASILQPVVRALARWRIPPAVTVILLMLVLFAGLVQAGLVLQGEVRRFFELEGADALPSISAPVDPGSVPGQGNAAGWDQVLAVIKNRLTKSALPEFMRNFLVDSLEKTDLAGLAANVLGGGFGFTKGLMLVMIYMIFIFAEQAVFRRKILSVAGARDEEAAQVLENISTGIQRYLSVKTVVSLATGVLAYAALVAIEAPYAGFFGLLTFLLNYIPTFGSIIAGLFASFTVFALEGESPWTKALIVAGAFLVINFALGNILEPKIMGRELGLSPLIVIISVVVWGGIWGVEGGFLAVPLTQAIQIIFAGQEMTRPIAVMMSSGPPKEERRRRKSPPGGSADPGPV